MIQGTEDYESYDRVLEIIKLNSDDSTGNNNIDNRYIYEMLRELRLL